MPYFYHAIVRAGLAPGIITPASQGVVAPEGAAMISTRADLFEGPAGGSGSAGR